MAIRYPRNTLASGQPLDHEEFNENLRGFASELDGRLNEHNWDDAATNGLTISDMHPASVLVIKQAFQTVDTFVLAGGPPATGLTNSFRALNNLSWTVIDDLSLTVEAGDSLLWILASFQHQRTPTATANIVGCQYAISIDGEIISESIVGGVDRSNDRKGEALAWKYSPIVLEAIVPVAPGRRIIEVVARVPRNEDFAVQNSLVDYYEVLHRELIAVVLDPPSGSLAGSAGTWAPTQEGTLVSAASLNASFSAVSNYINDLPPTAIQKGSLTADHLPSLVIDTKSERIGQSGGAHTYTNVYPGYNVDTIGNPGWAVIVDALSNALDVSFSSNIDLTTAGVRGILVLANIHATVGETPHSSNAGSDEHLALFAIQIVDSGGAVHTIKKTERFLNSETADGTLWRAIRKDVAIRTLITSADFAGSVSTVRVVVSVISSTGGGVSPKISLEQGNLTAVALRAGSNNA